MVCPLLAARPWMSTCPVPGVHQGLTHNHHADCGVFLDDAAAVEKREEAHRQRMSME